MLQTFAATAAPRPKRSSRCEFRQITRPFARTELRTLHIILVYISPRTRPFLSTKNAAWLKDLGVGLGVVWSFPLPSPLERKLFKNFPRLSIIYACGRCNLYSTNIRRVHSSILQVFESSLLRDVVTKAYTNKHIAHVLAEWDFVNVTIVIVVIFRDLIHGTVRESDAEIQMVFWVWKFKKTCFDVQQI